MYALFRRYGITSDKFVWSLNHFVRLTKQFQVVPTLPVTASVVDRHPRIFQRLQNQGVEIAVHGKIHIDYTQLNINETRDHLYQAAEIFRKHGIRYLGYRFPFLRKNDERIKLLREPGFLWDSSEVISWNSLDSNMFHHKNWKDYEKILKTYRADDADRKRSLPHIENELVEIPVSVPDDDIIIERLGIRDADLIYSIWEKMVLRVRNRKELLVMQMHPERYNIYKNALRRILKLITEQSDAWIASLGEIAQWWQERNSFQLRMTRLNSNRYQIHVDCTERATILMNHGAFNDSDKMRNARNLEIESRKKPIIGIDPDTTYNVFELLKREGYPYEVSTRRHDYNYFLKHVGEFNLNDEKQLLQSIDHHQYPLINFWRWPDEHRYAFALTGDIDGVDLWDYGERLYG